MNTQKLQRNKYIILVIILIVVILVIRINGDEDSVESITFVPTVTLKSIGNDSTDFLVEATGEVDSSDKFELRAEISEPVQSVRVNIGDTVFPGQTLMTLQSDALRAQMNQLQAQLDSEKAALQDMVNGTRTEQIDVLESQVASAQVALKNAESSLLDKVRDAYTKADDLVHNSLDTFFYDPLTNQPDLIFTTNDSQAEIYLERERVTIEAMLIDWNELVNAGTILSRDEAAVLVDEAQSNLEFLRTYTNALAAVVNNATPSSSFDASTIAGWKTLVSSMRNAVNAAITSLISARDNLAQSEASLNVATKQLSLGLAGATKEQVAIQKSRVAGAEANMQSLQVTINKTIISAPIRGVVAEIPINRGDLVSPGQHLITVLNKDALSVTVHISTENLEQIAIGSPVLINSLSSGVVTRIAPAINSQTQKVEVQINITQANEPLIDGQFVTVGIAAETDALTVPLAAIKTIDQDTYVYTVDTDNTIRTRLVRLGDIVGSNVTVLSGLEDVTAIVETVGDIQPNTTVTVAEN